MPYLKRRSRLRLRASSAYAVEVLESRVLLSTFMVTNTLDSGAGSLRADIQMSNAAGGANTVAFAPGMAGTIALTSGQLEVSNDLTIVGPGSGLLSISGGQNGGRIFKIDAGVTASITNLTITDGGAGNDGGGAVNNLGTLSISGCVLSDNRAAANGGAIYTNGPMLTITNSVIDNNSENIFPAGTFPPGGGSGGGIYAASGKVIIVGSTISGNSAGDAVYSQTALVGGGSGGGIYSAADLELADDTITANAAGAGLNGTIHPITNPTRGGDGGGIYSVGPLQLNNVTISGNRTGTGGFSVFGNGGSGRGGGIFADGATVLNNTIVAGNLLGMYQAIFQNPPDDVYGAVNSSSSYNLVGDGTGVTGLSSGNGNQIGTDKSPINPKLAALGNYGGSTPTMPPLPGSPAIDAGSNSLAVAPDGTLLAADQRGFPRIVDATHSGTPIVDIGAAEAAPFPLPLIVTTALDRFDPNYNATHLSLREAVAMAGMLRGPNTITFAPTVSGSMMLDSTLGPLELSGRTGRVTVTGPGSAKLSILSQNQSMLLQVDSGATMEIDGLTLDGSPVMNSATVVNSGTLDIANCALGRGGIANQGTLQLTACTVTEGISNASGALLSVSQCTIYGTGAFVGAYSSGAGAIQNFGAANVTSSTLSGNGASGAGGAIQNDGSMRVTNCTMTGNHAGVGGSSPPGGGAISNLDQGSLILENCEISNNGVLQGNGGGIENTGALTMINCTVANNTATSLEEPDGISYGGSGGGIANLGTLRLTNCTIANNTVSAGASTNAVVRGGGILAEVGGRLTIDNILVAGDHAIDTYGVSGPDDVSGAFDPASAYNLIEDGDGATGLTTTNHNQIGTAVAPIDPRLGPLANNGGATQTMALLFDSPAIDAGSNAFAVGLLTDQRGYYRIFNGTVDIGALEYGSSPLLPGDANADGMVDFADLVLVARNYGKSVSLTSTATAMFSASLVGTASSPSLPASACDLAQPPHVHALRHGHGHARA